MYIRIHTHFAIRLNNYYYGKTKKTYLIVIMENFVTLQPTPTYATTFSKFKKTF